ncbi:GtrA family protein [Spongiactinospora sp. TRM90649]|uniref:GtrA family protein n=1 Tax=Spongiactinospora sp. TRM90649 TaxID=3031114 RepID=UPI0023F848E8|nr:GtrA family protein [Spongiactinospora sp. TRM90649]MDF5758186.1 GtrA family protein [Spongiactinospora sp. TRM90649]
MRFKLLEQRGRRLAREIASFGAVGGVAFVLNMAVTNLLWAAWGDWGTLTAPVLATVVTTTFAYFANRHWTWRGMGRQGLAREYFVFFTLNGIGLLLELLFVGFARYTLDTDDQLLLNLAKLCGVALGTVFRFWSYKKWIFVLEPDQQVSRAAKK